MNRYILQGIAGDLESGMQVLIIRPAYISENNIRYQITDYTDPDLLDYLDIIGPEVDGVIGGDYDVVVAPESTAKKKGVRFDPYTDIVLF